MTCPPSRTRSAGCIAAWDFGAGDCRSYWVPVSGGEGTPSGGPGTASETINLYLYLQAFAFYNIGNASAVVVVFFVIVLALALVLLHVREKTRWS